MQPIPTRENITPVVEALAQGLAELTDVVLDEVAKERMVTGLVTQKYYILSGNLSATITYIGVSFHFQDGPDVTLQRVDRQPTNDCSQQLMSRMVSAWYRTIGETPQHAVARAAVKTLCAHLESQGWDAIPPEKHELMVNAMISTHLVGIRISKSDWRRANLTLINVERKPWVMLFGPEHMDSESAAANAALTEVLASW